MFEITFIERKELKVQVIVNHYCENIMTREWVLEKNQRDEKENQSNVYEAQEVILTLR